MRVFQAQKLSEAISLALSQVEPIAETEEILSTSAYGRILAHEVVCPEDIPGFARSAMDGYAVRAQDICGASCENPVTLRVIGSVQMGQDPRALSRVTEGEAMEVSTGGPLPPGADAVVMLEETERQSSDTVRIFSAGVVGTHVLAADSDFQRGERVFRAGHRLRAVDVGALLVMGVLSVKVYRRVRVGILSTGDELVEAEREIRPGQIRQINSHILRGLIESEGAQGGYYGIVSDDREELQAAVQQAVSEHDMVLLSGGSSVGSRDWTLDVLQTLGEVFIHGVQIKPGKPTIFAVLDKKPVVGLPGNPVSCAIVFEKFVRPVLARRGGLKVLLPSHKLASAQLTQTVRSAVGREDFVTVRLRLDAEQGALYAEPLPGHSNNISTLARADGILSVPADLEEIPQGAQVWVELL